MSFKNRLESNREILKLLSKRIEENTDERFCQMLSNLGLDRIDLCYNVESSSTLGHLKTVLEIEDLKDETSNS